jgi:hypothetical protein
LPSQFGDSETICNIAPAWFPFQRQAPENPAEFFDSAASRTKSWPISKLNHAYRNCNGAEYDLCQENSQTGPVFGYFASIAVAFLASGWIAGMVSGPVAGMSDYFSPASWRATIAAGLFVGIVFANPVGAFVARTSAFSSSLVKSVLRFFLGLGVGIAMQVIVVAPFAGNGMSHFLFLMLAMLAVPALLCVRKAQAFLTGRGFAPARALARMVSWMLDLPDRIVFIILMSGSFTVFWRYAIDPYHLMIGLGAALALLTCWVAFGLRKPQPALNSSQSVQDVWLDLDPEEVAEPSVSQKASATVKRLVRVVLPGAVLLGGVTRLVADVMLRLYPDLAMTARDPVAALRTLGLVATSGLGLILLSMLALLGFSLTLLFVIGRVQSWSARTYRRHGKILVSMMHFRPRRSP